MKVLIYCDYNTKKNDDDDDDDDDDYSDDNCDYGSDDDDRLCLWYRIIISSPCISLMSQEQQ